MAVYVVADGGSGAVYVSADGDCGTGGLLLTWHLAWRRLQGTGLGLAWGWRLSVQRGSCWDGDGAGITKGTMSPWAGCLDVTVSQTSGFGVWGQVVGAGREGGAVAAGEGL